MKKEYREYIEKWPHEHENNCINFSVEMMTNFPELTLCIGYVVTKSLSPEGFLGAIEGLEIPDGVSLDEMVTSHCWLKDPDGCIVDPSPLKGVVEYIEWDKSTPYLIPDWASMIPACQFRSILRKIRGRVC